MLKSKIYPVNTVPNLNELADIMACEIGSFPATYLGLPLGAEYKADEVWNEVIEKVEKRLGNWHMQYLSMGGRLTLINSVLDNIPTYIMSLLPMSSVVISKLDKLRRSFLWEGNSEEHKFHLVKWKKVLRPKEQGGLGIRDLSKHNKSLLMKWWWRFSQGPPAVWKDVVIAKYGRQDNWCTTKTRAPHGVGPWKHINNMKDDFFQEVSFRVGNGTNVKFWKDRWLLNFPLKESHPRLFLIATYPDSTVAKNRDGNIWDLRFRRNLQDWELDELFDLYNLLDGFSVNPQAPDSLKWNGSSKGVYSVKAGFNRLNIPNALTDHWPWKLVWKTKLPPKIKCFLWTALLNGTLTHDNLKKKGFQIANRCFMCHLKEETVNYLFLHCPVAAGIWSMYLAVFGISWSTPSTLKEAVESWSLWKVDRSIKRIWQMIPACISWSVWIERNNRCFDGTSTPNCSLKSKSLVNLYSWSNYSPVNDVISLVDFISSLSLA